MRAALPLQSMDRCDEEEIGAGGADMCCAAMQGDSGLKLLLAVGGR